MISAQCHVAAGLLALSAMAVPVSAQRVSVRSVEPARVVFTERGGQATVTVVGPGVETLTSGHVEVDRRPIREIRVRVSPAGKGQARVLLVAEARLKGFSGTLVLSNRGGTVAIPGLEVAVASEAPRLVAVYAEPATVQGGETLVVRVLFDRDVRADTEVALRYATPLEGDPMVVVPRGRREGKAVVRTRPVPSDGAASIEASMDTERARATVRVTAPAVVFAPVVVTTSTVRVRGDVFTPVVVTAPELRVRVAPPTVFTPVELTTPTATVRGDVFRPVELTTPTVAVRGDAFRPIQITTPVLRVRANGGSQP